MAGSTNSLDLPEPTNLSARSEGDAVVISWEEIQSAYLTGYNIFVDGELQNAEPVKATEYALSGLEREKTYKVKVSAVYQSQQEEGIDVSLAIAPVVIKGVQAVGGPSSVAIHWEAVSSVQLQGYNVYVNGQLANTKPIQNTEFNAAGLNYGTAYSFEVKAVDRTGKTIASSETVPGTPSHYLVELSRWNIHNDGTDAAATTDGLNRMLAWASGERIQAIYVPGGTYLISKDKQINVAANMLWELAQNAIVQKETNGKESYKTLSIGYGADNVTIKGGAYKGDRETHDFSGKDSPSSPGTHEGGYGIAIEGAQNVTIVGVKATHFTGDGLFIGGAGQMGSDFYAGNFESGGLNAAGAPIVDKNKIRTVKMYSLTKNQFIDQGYFELSNWRNASSFEIYFYDKNQAFISKTAAKVRDRIDIPKGAAQMRIVINQPSAANVYGEYWQRLQAGNTVVRDSEFAFNRRQGITVGGGDRTLIENNRIHDINGTAPMSGIDVEGGFGENGFWNSNVTIRGNEFWNNARYDVILYDGRGAVVDNNHLSSKGAIGLAVSASFAGDTVAKNNHFDGTRILAYHDVQLLNNKMNDSYVNVTGPNLMIDGLDIVNGTLNTSAAANGDIAASNISITIADDTKEGGLSVYGTGATIFRNVKISGPSKLRSFVGGSTAANTFDRLQVLNYNSTYGLSLPAGSYTDCSFEASEGGQMGAIGISLPAKYVFDRARFKTNSTSGSVGIIVQRAGSDVTIRNSQFEVLGDSQPVSVQTADRFVFENNVVKAMNMQRKTLELVRINDYWDRGKPYDVLAARIEGNVINANIAVIGIQTAYAGTGAPPYTIRNNTLNKAVLSLKANDIASGNIVNP